MTRCAQKFESPRIDLLKETEKFASCTTVHSTYQLWSLSALTSNMDNDILVKNHNTLDSCSHQVPVSSYAISYQSLSPSPNAYAPCATFINSQTA